MENNNNAAAQQAAEGQEEERAPTFDELATSSTNFISAKNYDKGKKVTFTFGAVDQMQKSDTYGTWQCIYNVTMPNGEEKKYGMPGKVAKVLRDDYGVKGFADVFNKTITMLVVKTSSGAHTFEVVDLKSPAVQAQVGA